MTKKFENTVIVTHEMAEAARREITPELLAWLDALTDEDIAAQIASNPDAAPELDDAWFERARLVTPLKGRRAA
jgi:predicted HAD superfamily phosphohydrolase YqeG